MRRVRTFAAVVALVVVVALAGLWLARDRIAQRAVDRELTRLALPGRVVVEDVSPSRVLVRDLALGPAARPDLTAARAEIALDWDGTQPKLAGARLDRPVLRVAVDRDGRVRLGTLDRLLPPRTGEPTRFPDLDIAVDDGFLIADTPFGAVRARVTGDGNPAHRFRGSARIEPATLTIGGCTLAGVTGTLRLRAAQRSGFVTGELAVPAPACAGMRARTARLAVDLRAPETLDRASGTLRLRLAAPRTAAGGARAAQVVFGGTATPARIDGDVVASLADVRAGDWSAAAARLAGPLSYEPDRGEFDGQGMLRLTGVTLAAAARAAVARPTAGLAITPLGPLEAAARRAAAGALAAFDLSATIAEASEGGRRFVSLAALDAVAASGVRARLRDGAVAIALDGGSPSASGALEVSGGGSPAFAARLGDGVASVTLAEWRAGGSRLAPTTLALATGADGVSIAGPILLDGPLASGRVEGLSLPAADVALAIGDRFSATLPRCLPVRAGRLEQPRYTLTDATFDLCPVRGPAFAVAADGRLAGAFTARALSLSGVVADTPFQAAAPDVAITIQGSDTRPVVDATARRLNAIATLGEISGELALATFDVTATQERAGWRFAGRGDGGTLGGLPATVTGLAGDWAMDEGGALSLTRAVARVADREASPRFEPLALSGLAATYDNGRAAGRADIALAVGGATLGWVRPEYDFATSSGALAVHADVTFGEALQPFHLSARARGVVENVVGRVTGGTDLVWRDGALAGPGRVALDKVSFATAALGPVREVSGAVAFTDAPGLISPPGQRFTIGGVDPGVAVAGGEALLQMLGGGRVRVERLAFPLAGGVLTLDPITLDPAVADRDFTLNVTALDAARFVEALELTNFAATGIFDGVLPLKVSQTGSRITGGRLTARAPGGTLNYVGEIGDDLPGAARLAFDALKSMRYRNLTLGIDGDLDGELVTDLRFTGENQRPVRPGGMLPALRPGVPFRFNVTVTAPFRRLLGTAAGLSDARPLIDEGLLNGEPSPR